ncbi:aquaporin [Lysobacter soyae]|uniref:Aquaporin family protein n=1 Tax=Lysobacter soyae TaxID=2764185 RepID=A0ABX8WN95_9GAMM|nr:MIP/aquaporin family protein [Lysobacter sp. CJ11]QYR52844.1 aquaporin family protein [Lysobacter sp. CJ11]
MSLLRKLAAELLGTMLLLSCVVGSGIMGTQLSQGNDAIALLANAGATAGILYLLITVLGPVSGAHFNPAVTLVMRLRGDLGTKESASYVAAQLIGAMAGVMLAHAMFDQHLVQIGTRVRTGPAQWLSEGIATFGLVLTIVLGLRFRQSAIPALVASYIFAAYWFTASTSFANPAVTVARALTKSFAGIRPDDVLAFVAAQCAGALLAWVASSLLLDSETRRETV